MSSLQVGIVGLPNVGKSTLFNALLRKQQAFVANYPFTTIEPNVGIVPVPDPRLEKLAQTVKESEKLDHLPPQIPATVKFVDIAGLVAGAHISRDLLFTNTYFEFSFKVKIPKARRERMILIRDELGRIVSSTAPEVTYS